MYSLGEAYPEVYSPLHKGAVLILQPNVSTSEVDYICYTD